MSWDEFATLLSGLNTETPLGRTVAIRSEKDKEKIKNFSPEERRIRNEWLKKNREVVTDKVKYDNAMNNFASMFRAMSEKGG